MVASTSANTSTRASSAIASCRGMLSPPSVTKNRVAQYASRTPAMPPTNASTNASVTIWRISMPRPAPSAVRIASSFRRADVRPSIRLARFAQAISSTNPTDASNTSSGRSMLPTTCRCSPTTLTP